MTVDWDLAASVAARIGIAAVVYLVIRSVAALCGVATLALLNWLTQKPRRPTKTAKQAEADFQQKLKEGAR